MKFHNSKASSGFCFMFFFIIKSKYLDCKTHCFLPLPTTTW